MNMDDLIAHVAKSTDLTQAKVREAISATFDGISAALAKGEDLTVKGFGSFRISERQARMGRNPQTQEPLHIAASKSVAFKASKVLKDSVNG